MPITVKARHPWRKRHGLCFLQKRSVWCILMHQLAVGGWWLVGWLMLTGVTPVASEMKSLEWYVSIRMNEKQLCIKQQPNKWAMSKYMVLLLVWPWVKTFQQFLLFFYFRYIDRIHSYVSRCHCMPIVADIPGQSCVIHIARQLLYCKSMKWIEVIPLEMPEFKLFPNDRAFHCFLTFMTLASFHAPPLKLCLELKKRIIKKKIV